MNFLVTGGAGFIGSNFVSYHLQNYPEDQVVVIDKLSYAGNQSTIDILQKIKPFTFIKGDITEQTLIEQIITDHQIDTIIHFAAETHVDRSISNPKDFIDSNIYGTFAILEAIRKYPQVRLHHVSTDEVFGSLSIDNPALKFDETTKYDPQSPYSASKAASDHLVRSYVNTFNIKATISNCSNNYGPFHFPEKLIPLAITRAIDNQQIPVYGDGMQIRDWIYVADHCLGIDLVLQKGKIGETYLLGGDGEKTNLWIIQQILQLLEKPDDLIVHVGDRLGHDKRYAVDFTKAKNQLGFVPQKDIIERLKETVDWYLENEDWWRPLKGEADKIAERYLRNRI